jgi:hypothetical protein
MNRIILAGALSCSLLALGACTSEEEQATLNGISAACAALPVGTTIAIQVASAIPGGAGAAAIAGTVQGVGGAACSTLIPAAQSIIDSVTKAGATAVVTATTVDPSGAKSVRRLQVTPAGKVFFSGTVPPSSFFGL